MSQELSGVDRICLRAGVHGAGRSLLRSLHEAEQVEQHRVDCLKRVVDRERGVIEALRDNPAVLARLAQRDLGFQRAGERPIPVAVPPVTRPSEKPFVPRPVPFPSDRA